MTGLALSCKLGGLLASVQRRTLTEAHSSTKFPQISRSRICVFVSFRRSHRRFLQKVEAFCLALRRLVDLGQVPIPHSALIMAPITDQHVEDLKDLVHKLESRVYSLERRLEGGDKKPSVTDSMRLILIGPPGAGELSVYFISRVY